MLQHMLRQPMHDAAAKSAVRILFLDQDGVCISRFPLVFTEMKPPAACMRRSLAVHHQVFDNRGKPCAVRFDVDGIIKILELAHVELAGRHAAHRSGTAVDYQRARTADTFAAVSGRIRRVTVFVPPAFQFNVQHFTGTTYRAKRRSFCIP